MNLTGFVIAEGTSYIQIGKKTYYLLVMYQSIPSVAIPQANF